MEATLEHQQVYKGNTIMIWKANDNRFFSVGNKNFESIKEVKQNIDINILNRKKILAKIRKEK